MKPIRLGKYLLLERTNVGVVAEIFVAKVLGDQGFERIVAIKRILPAMLLDDDFSTVFVDEARISVQLNHANIVHVLEFGVEDDNCFLAMEYISGQSLKTVLEHYRRLDQPMPIQQAAFIASKLCEGLDYAHKKRDARGKELGIVHRGVSPRNVLISYDGEPKLIDFGIAKASNRAQRTQAGILKGKVGYMSPEQVRGQPMDRRSDIFAVGVLLYEMLTSQRLFSGESDLNLYERVAEALVPPLRGFNPYIPDALEEIVLKALARDPEQRYAWASDLEEDLQRFIFEGDSIFSGKHLAGFMKAAFFSEAEREATRLQELAMLQPPLDDELPPLRPRSRSLPKLVLPPEIELAAAPPSDTMDGLDASPLPFDSPIQIQDSTQVVSVDTIVGAGAAPPVRPGGIEDAEPGTIFFPEDAPLPARAARAGAATDPALMKTGELLKPPSPHSSGDLPRVPGSAKRPGDKLRPAEKPGEPLWPSNAQTGERPRLKPNLPSGEHARSGGTAGTRSQTLDAVPRASGKERTDPHIAVGTSPSARSIPVQPPAESLLDRVIGLGKRQLVVVGAAVLSLLVIVALVIARPTRELARFHVRVEPAVQSATITVGGRVVALGAGQKLPAGEYDLVAAAPGYKRYAQKIRLLEGDQEVELMVFLEANEGRAASATGEAGRGKVFLARFVAAQPGIEILVEGKSVGRTPSALAPGLTVGKTYPFVARRPDGKTFTSEFRSDGSAPELEVAIPSEAEREPAPKKRPPVKAPGMAPAGQGQAGAQPQTGRR